MIYILIALGVILGYIVGVGAFRRGVKGCIHVDETNVEKDIYTFEFYVPPYQINDSKYVIFEIRKKNTE